jgi:hypothetical protein
MELDLTFPYTTLRLCTHVTDSFTSIVQILVCVGIFGSVCVCIEYNCTGWLKG